MVQGTHKKNRKRRYRTKELVVYPSHGVGEIIGIEEQEIGGEPPTLRRFLCKRKNDPPRASEQSG